MSAGSQRMDELLAEFLDRRRGDADLSARAFAAEHPEFGPELGEALERAGRGACDGETLASEPVPWTPPAAEAIGAFRIVRELGRGGMGVVFEAVEQPLGRRVALKVLPAELVQSQAARARFRREAQLAARLSHPAVCTVYGAGIDSEHPWISMRLVEGTSLARRIAQARESPERRLGPPAGDPTGRGGAAWIARVIAQVARALESAHALGIVHRDVKPSNVMITPAGEPVLLDFGLALEPDSGHTLVTRSGELLGTPAYLPPEAVSGEVAQGDARGDVYALGVTLYECLALRTPFQGPTPLALCQAIVAGKAPALRRLCPDLAPDLALVVETAMERDRARRYASAGDLARDLEAWLAGRPIAARPVSSLGRVASWARREPRAAALIGALVATGLSLAVLGGAYWASRDDVRSARRARLAAEVERAVTDGYAEIAARSPEGADARFAAALALDPANVEALGGRVLVSLLRGEPESARERLAGAPPLEVFERMRRSLEGGAGEPAEDERAWLERAGALELFLEGARLGTLAQQGPLSRRPALAARALRYLDEAVVRAPAARELYHLRRAEAASEAGDEAATRSSVAALLALHADSPVAQWVAGSSIQPFDIERSIAMLRRALELDPDCEPALLNLANAYVLLDEAASAEPLLRRALALDPRAAEAHNGLGLALFDLGRVDEARAAYRAALALAPGMLEAWENLGDLEFAVQDYSAALAAQERAVALDPDYPSSRYDYGIALYYTGRLEEARAQFEALIAGDPGDCNPWSGLAWTWLGLGRPRDALLAVEAGLARRPDDGELLEVRAEAQRALSAQR